MRKHPSNTAEKIKADVNATVAAVSGNRHVIHGIYFSGAVSVSIQSPSGGTFVFSVGFAAETTGYLEFPGGFPLAENTSFFVEVTGVGAEQGQVLYS